MYLLGVHDMQQALHKAGPGDYKHAVNEIKLSKEVANVGSTAGVEWSSWNGFLSVA